jgi:hypothetical protein
MGGGASIPETEEAARENGYTTLQIKAHLISNDKVDFDGDCTYKVLPLCSFY